MIRTLRESKAKLSELVEIASRGEDVLISVRGKLRARLTGIGAPEGGGAGWARELRALQRAYGKARCTTTTEEILAEDRADRT